jgi:DNA-binding LacI/PurR family transcriptional regulator/ABC-type glycerol-3-phosphate transport system substrate-binding protein
VPTIKDVAKQAGVSLGTVSNVINGYRSVKSDIVKRVETAIKDLGYQPNLKAQSMRNSKSGYIGVLLPNITDNIYIRIYNGVERIASKNGYIIALHISNGSPEIEEILFSRMQQQRIDGAVIITCMPDKADVFEQMVRSGIKLVFVRRMPRNLKNTVFFGIDEKKAVYDAALNLVKAGFSEIALLSGRVEYSNEKDCILGYKEAIAAVDGRSRGKIVESIGGGKENAFRTAVRWIHEEPNLQAIITTCPEYAMGILSAMELLHREKPPLILSLDNNNWGPTASTPESIKIFQQYDRLGAEAAKKLLVMIKSADKSRGKKTLLPAEPFTYSARPLIQDSIRRNIFPEFRKGRLRILMLENTSSAAGKLMRRVFTKETGIEVEIDTLPYEMMFEHTIGPSGAGKYDLIQINIPWLNEAVKRDIIVPLNSMFSEDSHVFSAFPDEILIQHGMAGGKLYAIPFLVGVQMLFYRKDIFKNLRLRRLYYEKNKAPLEVPATWKDYDRIAQFFTKKYNSESPVPYGTTLGRVNGIYYYILRLWEEGISLFRENCLKSSKIFKKAADILGQYYKVFNFADPEAIHWTQVEQADQFCRGNSAMMVIYQAHFADHLYNLESTVYKENIGFAPLPNRTSILGGWSLGIRKDSVMKEEAMRFLEWLCKNNNSISYNILGGSIPGTVIFNSFEMLNSYPWLSQTIEGVKYSRSMIDRGVQWISQWEFESAGEKTLNRLLDGELSIEDTVEELWRKLSAIKARYTSGVTIQPIPHLGSI